jgi:hypothetical protein
VSAPPLAETIRPRAAAAAVKPAPTVREEPKPAGGPARPEKPAGAPGFVLPAATVAVAPGAISEPPPAAVAPPSAPAPAPVAAEPPAAKPAAAAPTLPTIPYYELVQVDRPPQVASRVEPRLEGVENVTKEIVIVRVLVSQTGQPHLVRLLRPSKSGPALDAAVIAAVEQYTFRPAAKRGEAVSCWLHTAVTITR